MRSRNSACAVEAVNAVALRNKTHAYPLKHLLKRSSIVYMADMTDSKKARDANILLARLRAGTIGVDESGRMVTEDGRDLAAVLLGQKGGLRGGKARASSLSPEERQKIARRAAAARWSKRNES